MTAVLTEQARQTLLANRGHTHGAGGVAWVERLPALVSALAQAWSLRLEPASYGLSYNYVTRVRRAGGSPAVLKVCYPDDDFRREEEALRAFAGEGTARLLESDRGRAAMLLEALEPGHPVSSLRDDEAEVSATAGVIRALRRPPPQDCRLPTFGDVIDRIEQRAAAGGRDIPWLARGIALGRELLAGPAGPPLLLHGDLHHTNVLSSGEAWRCIDPHGVIGEQAWETGPYFYNNLSSTAGEAAWRRTVRRRADQFSDELGVDRQRVHACATAYAVISSAWSLEEGYDERRIVKRRAVMQELGGF